EAGWIKPGAVLALRGEKLPHARERPGNSVGWWYRPDDQRHAAGTQHAMSLGDRALRVGPVLDAARRDVAVEACVGKGERLRVAEQPPARRQGRPGARTRELVRALVEHDDAARVDARDDPLRGKARPGADLEPV